MKKSGPGYRSDLEAFHPTFSLSAPSSSSSNLAAREEAEAFAARITRNSQSNLALAFVCLPKDRRRDMNVFYAFCRLIDDIADNPAEADAHKQRQLDAWKSGLTGNPHALEADDALLCQLLLELVERRDVQPEHYLELIAGVEMDLAGRIYRTFDELKLYCHRVASVVGLVSIRLFGCQARESTDYALSLGLAFQITNIIRDVGRDYRESGRIYLPREEMERHGITETDIAGQRETEAFRNLIREQADRAKTYYRESHQFLQKQETQTLAAAEIMRSVYAKLLLKMERDDFRVLTRNYRLSKPLKLSLILRTLLATRLNKPSPIHV